MKGLSPTTEDLQSEAYTVLARYFSDQTARASDIQDECCRPIEDKYRTTGSTSDLEEPLTQLWKSMVYHAANIPHSDGAHQKLVSLVVSFQDRDGPPIEVQGKKLWQDLPLFGWQIREAWNLGNLHPNDGQHEKSTDINKAPSDSSDEKHQQQWINLNAFAARLVATRGTPDLSLFGLWTIRSALEEEKPSSPAAAAVWFIYASPALCALCRDGKTFDGKVAKPGGLASNEGWRGFSRERWEFWGSRLNDVDGLTELRDQAKEAMNLALQK